MAVLTPVSRDDARALTSAYALEPFESIAGIAAGSVNSNFEIGAGGRRTFLRLYEEQDLLGAQRETAMLERLAAAGVPTPSPLRRVDGLLVSLISGKPAALFPWRDGAMRCQASVTPADTRRVGASLARVHLAGAAERDVPAGRFRYEDLLLRVDAIARSPDGEFAARAPWLRDALGRAHRERNPALPRGMTHGDLFRDNVLWEPGGGIAALLDFESACEGTYAYDLMVTVLSWCVGDDLDPALASSLREGYESVRPLDGDERRALCAEGSFACLRFTVTRITDYALRADTGGPRSVKDWRRFMKRFEKLQALGPDGVRAVLGA